MTRRFNLLPGDHVERIAERRRAAVTVALLIGVLALFAGDTFAQGRQMARAEKTRDTEQARNAELQARRRQLQPFRQLADDIIGRERLLSVGMQTQVSWATLLSSLSRTFPTDASLTSFTAKSALPAFGTVPGTLSTPGSVIGSTKLAGYSVRKFTPGVDRMLQLLTSVTGFSEPRLQVGAVETIGTQPVTTFEGTTFLDTRALTGRYEKGLPPEDHVDVPVAGRAAAPAAAATTATTATTRAPG